ncbi:uncharacterized protein LOC135687527 [Rhopilema esculentum]|uniref:uncharacterized protein LOC135687527 n=1 Tax=Rhopilema esculentum TaxID=499914 RepID=UPI0031D1D386|eukprot:gene5898-11233_t
MVPTESGEKKAPTAAHDSANKDFLSIFWDLVSNDEGKRTHRAADLVSILKNKIQETDPENDEMQIPEELDYSVKRLVKGIGSARKGARQGFGTALTEIMCHFDCVHTDTIYKLMEDHLNVQGSFKAQEERDAFIGRTLCLAAMIQSQNPTMDNYQEFLSKTVKILMDMMKKKTYLLELCTKLVIDTLEKIDETSFTKTVFPILEDYLTEGWQKSTPESLCILLAINRCFKEAADSLLKDHWKCSNIFEEENLKKVGKIIMESTINAHPRMHIVWKEVLPCLLSNDETLKSFWQIVVEGQLMKSSHERKFLAFSLLEELFSKVTETQVETVVSEALLKSVINGSSSDKNYLWSASRKLLSSIPSQVSQNCNQGVSLAVIRQIIFRSKTIVFDSLTKSKAIENLIGKLDSSGILSFISWLKLIFTQGSIEEIKTDEDEDDEDTRLQIRKWAASQLLIVLRNSSLKRDEPWVLDIAKFLFFHGHFRAVKTKKGKGELYRVVDPALEDSVIGLCKERFLGALGELSTTHQSTKESKSGKHAVNSIPGILANGDFYAYHLVQFSQELLKDSKYIVLIKEWTPEAKETFKEALGMIEEIREKVSRDSVMSEDRAFELLFLHSCLQMFHNTNEAADVIQELIQCYKKLKEKKKKKSSEEPHWSEVLTEILLSFLAQSSHMMRQIVNLVFTMMLPHITNNAFQLIMEALRPKKNAGLEIVDESEDEMEAAENGDHETDSEEDEDSDDDSESEEENNKDEIDEAFKNEVKVALGDAAIDEESDKEESESEDSDVDMDTVDPKVLDSMDKALAAAFKTRMQSRSGKKKQSEEKKTIVHFRLRVLDIAELIVKKEPKSPFILEMIEPLLEIIKVSLMYKEEKELHDRAQGILKNRICHAREIPNGNDVNKEEVHTKIEKLLELAQNASSVQMVDLITNSCMYLIRVLRGKEDMKEPSPLKTRKQRQKDDENKDKESTNPHGTLDCKRVVRMFEGALEDFMTRRSSQLHPVFFLEFIKRYPAIAWKLSPVLPKYINKAVNNFRKVQACEMLLQLLARKTECAADDFEGMSNELQREVIQTLRETLDEKCTMKARHINEIAKLLDRFLKENDAIFKVPIDDQLSSTLNAAIDGPIISRSPQLVAYCKRIVGVLSGEQKSLEKTKKRKIKPSPSSKLEWKETATVSPKEEVKESIENNSEPKKKKKKKGKAKE